MQISHDDDDDDNAVAQFVSTLILVKHPATGLKEAQDLGKEVVLSVSVVTRS
ncbi:hypothetical protein [Enterobacter cloacae]|uniref:hypothetical protein n=1 Tax=Enterobacter cloacae TaxID=550 RepID=UPI00197AF13C|nr:hypothetical protein [Enterobacter cloacae]